MTLMDTRFHVSPVFLLTLAICFFSAFPMINGEAVSDIWTFLFVVSGWIISLCLHEFGHAFAAYKFGDLSVADKGYLTLNPLKYSNLVMSIVFPVVFLMMGGIGFPGGAVYINMNAIKTPREKSLVSAAGPIGTAIFAFVLTLPFWSGMAANSDYITFWSALSLLAFLQISALVLNLLPVPGLDGFGIIEPFLKGDLKKKIHNVSGIAILVIFFLLFNDTPVSQAFWTSIAFIAKIFGLNFDLVRQGFSVFTFWN
jgi:Zn-dependent protease